MFSREIPKAKMGSIYEKHDLRHIKGRILVAGDIHGYYNELKRALERARFNHEEDVLVFLGDMINRGPESHKAKKWLKHYRVMGNHEFAISKLGPQAIENASGVYGWLKKIEDSAKRQKFVRKLSAAPIMLEILTPKGHKVGFVHAGIPVLDWNDLMMKIDDKQIQKEIMSFGLNRNQIGQDPNWKVQNIDHLFVGHTPVSSATKISNVTFCDVSKTERRVDLLDIDEWILK